MLENRKACAASAVKSSCFVSKTSENGLNLLRRYRWFCCCCAVVVDDDVGTADGDVVGVGVGLEMREEEACGDGREDRDKSKGSVRKA